ncbi:hypothetical protein KIH41_07845 [Litoribacter ruber]|uniref:hypothetical protein n=1 Tax=Litoribacter ruber TaxID=702568 RepID=UPI001BD94991|nr:hypothetical protein [Litoribacter ruber]MBT0811189.1 hypothetical protein [Litoribacter ruber]
MKNLLLIPFCIAFLACGNKNEVESEATSFTLERVDSFQVDYLTHVRILDYSPEEDIFLAFSEGDDNFIELDPNGKILKTVNRKGEGPDTFGARNPVALSFGPHGERMVQTSFQLISYDQDYQQTHKSGIRNMLPVRANVPLGKNQFFNLDGDYHYLVGPSTYLSNHALIHDEEGRDTLQNFLVLNFETGALQSAVPYGPEGVYKETDHIYYNLMGKSYFIQDDELFVAQNLGSSIQVYDLKNDFKLSRQIPISHKNWKKATPIPLGSNSDMDKVNAIFHTSGRNKSLYPINENTFLLSYYTGIAQSKYETFRSEGISFMPKNLRDENKLLIFRDGRQLEGEIDLPSGTMLFSLPGDRLLVLDETNEDVEEEFTKYSIYQLKEGNATSSQSFQ